MNICVYGAASTTIDSSFLEAGEALGREMAKRGHSLVFGGGASGMMGAVVRGVAEMKGSSIAIVPSFFNVDGVLFENCTEQIFTETMRERKQLLEQKSDAFFVTPGGIGTFDEFFEIFTLRSLDCHKKPIVLLNFNGYFNKLINFLDYSVKENFISPEVMELLTVTDDIVEAIGIVEAGV